MFKKNIHTVIEVWNEMYIKCPELRAIEDKNAEIIQIEYAHDDLYIVEVRKEERV